MADLSVIYPYLPVALQNLACWYYGRKEARVRFGPFFRRTLAQLLDSEYCTSADISAYQDENLRQLIGHAYHSVPYYRDLMGQAKLAPQDIRCRADLQKLPVLTKEGVRHNFERLVSEKANSRELLLRHTSGTTGKSLHFYSAKSSIAFQWAVWWRHRMRFGLQCDDWHANFTGKLVVPPNQQRPPYWRWNRPMRQALINMHHLTPVKIADVVGFLNEHDFVYYSGYPSVIHALALTAKESGHKLKAPPRVIVTGAENVLQYQRHDIEEYTGAVLTDQYGLSEGCGNASQCPEFLYHEDFEFGILECLEPQNLANGRIRGKIVCTGFANPDFPFIRYDTGDTGIWENSDSVCRCGRKSRVLVAIDGRTDDYVITPEGRRIMRFDYIFKEASNVKESQIVQEKLGEITVRVVRRPAYGSRDERFVADEIHKWISPQLRLNFEYIGEIERENNGKFRAVKSLLRAEGLATSDKQRAAT